MISFSRNIPLTIPLFLLALTLMAPTNVMGKANNLKPDKTRKYEEVKQGMVAIFPDITKALQKVSSLYQKSKSIDLKFYISPTGVMSFRGFIGLDTDHPKEVAFLQKSLHMNVLIPVQKIETYTKVIVTSTIDSKNTIILSKKIKVDYIEIRPKASIVIIIDLNRRELKKMYAQRWAENQDLHGTLTVRFQINEFGKVVSCSTHSSTLNDPIFEEEILAQVTLWNFGPINNPGDITEVVYPFTFSQ